MKVLIFEDEWPSIKGSFEMANIYAFHNELVFKNVIKTQDICFSCWSDEYDAVFVDITLAKNSDKDGYSIIKEIKEKQLFDLAKVVILTGNSKVEDKLLAMDIDPKTIKILYKPIEFVGLSKVLQEVLNR